MAAKKCEPRGQVLNGLPGQNGRALTTWREPVRVLAAEHALLLGLVIPYVGAYLTFCPHVTLWWSYVDLILLVGFTVPIAFAAIEIGRDIAGRRSYHWVVVLRGRATIRAAVRGVLVLALIAAFSAAATGWRSQIGSLRGFSWDPLFAATDRFLHFGHTPWVLLEPVLRMRLAVKLMDVFYGPIWHLTILSFVGWAAWTDKRRFRLRVLVCFGLTWIVLGTGLAYLVPAAGPIYFDRVVSGAPSAFTPERHLLEQYPGLINVAAARYLWQGFLVGAPPGITAMPSMHVAESTLVALAARHFGPAACALSYLFLAATLFCSVGFGWHYAIDGYTSILGVALLWWLSGRLATWYSRRCSPALSAT